MTQWTRTFFARLGQPEGATLWRMADVISTLAVMLGVFFLVGPMIGSLIFPDDLESAVLIGWLLGGLLTAGYVGLIQRYDRGALRMGQTRLPLTFILLLGLAIAITLDLIGFAVSDSSLNAPELANAAAFDTGYWILAFLIMVIVQPVAEELVFRGILLPTLRVSLGAWPGLLACGGLYGLFHLLVYTPPANAHWYVIVLPFLAGWILSAVRVTTDSTRAAIVIHMALGLFAILKALSLGG